MLTRGYFIGEIIDALSDVAVQVSTRNRLGLTDLNRYAEDFFKTILNQLYKLSLRNLNDERSNAPGLDLGDHANGIAFQITAERTSAKVNETLRKLTADQIATYPKIRVLMIAGKQSSYTLDADQCARVGFTTDDIWDIDVLCKRCMDLQIDTLQAVYDYIRTELARVKIELEIPDSEGNYPTNLAAYIEAVPKPQMSDLTTFSRFLEDAGHAAPIEKTRETFTDLSKSLARLPRITREFLAVMIERREPLRRRRWTTDIEINADKLERIAARYPDHTGELRVLKSYGFIDIDESGHANESHHWRIRLPGMDSDFQMWFFEYIEEKGIALNRVLVSLDFSAF